jgi:hypothetical protein
MHCQAKRFLQLNFYNYDPFKDAKLQSKTRKKSILSMFLCRSGRIWQLLNKMLVRAKDNIFEKHKTEMQHFLLIAEQLKNCLQGFSEKRSQTKKEIGNFYNFFVVKILSTFSPA